LAPRNLGAYTFLLFSEPFKRILGVFHEKDGDRAAQLRAKNHKEKKEKHLLMEQLDSMAHEVHTLSNPILSVNGNFESSEGS